MVHAYHSKLFVFLFLSFLLLSFLFILFYFFSFSMLTSGLCFFSKNSYYHDFSNPPIFSVHSKGSFIEPIVTSIYCFSPLLPLFGVGVLVDHLLVVSGSATTIYLCWLCRSPLPDKEGYFVCLLAVAFSTHYNVCALSFSPSWHALGGSNSSLLLLGSMSS